jgi:beta-glucosidase
MKKILAAAIIALMTSAHAQDTQPWMNKSLTPDERAAFVVSAMTETEKLQFVHGYYGVFLPGVQEFPPGFKADLPNSAGYIPGVPMLGIPSLKETDAGLGVANHRHMRPGDTATALPSGVLTAATWNPDTAYAAGTVLGSEARDKGFNVVLGGAVNLAREPRGGRTFEYAGEDPLLAGTIVGEEIRGTEAQGVISTVKHFALNDQETARTSLTANIPWAAARESDLLAFEIAIERGKPGAAMCSYNKVNHVYGCENPYTLTKVLKGDWAFPGWVMSDWGAVHSTVDAANAGLDQESAFLADHADYFGAALKTALNEGAVSLARLDNMVHRVLRSMFAAGIVDNPPVKRPTDLRSHAVIVQRDAEQGIVLLKNDGILPLATHARRIAVIGGHADLGVLSGGGSSQVVPIGDRPDTEIPISGPAFKFPGLGWVRQPAMVYDPPSPLAEIRKLTRAHVRYGDGSDIARAVALAKTSDVVILFAQQWMSETQDVSLALPGDQDALIAAVAAANPHTIVVLETGGPVLMPWIASVSAVVEAWYAGNRGGPAIADILFGKVNPSGHLPLTFPASAEQLPYPAIIGAGITSDPYAPGAVPRSVDADYFEGADVGYRWFEVKGETPLFPFGFGLSYTSFAFSDIEVTGGQALTVTFKLTNSGKRTGREVAQVYAVPPFARQKPAARLVGWASVDLKPGEARKVTVAADLRTLARFDERANLRRVAAGRYMVFVGASSVDRPLSGTADLDAAMIKP